MDQRLPYEEIISGKLQSLPIPDMADAIWARVEQQLDRDMPTDDSGGSTPPPRSGPSGGAIGWGASIFIIALLSLYLISKRGSPIIEPARSTAAPTIQPTGNDRVLQPPQIRNSIKKSSPPALTNNPPFEGRADSVFETTPPPTAVLPTVLDSVLAQKEDLVAVPPPQDTVKKRRGVSGLKDGDYRIVPKKGQQVRAATSSSERIKRGLAGGKNIRA